MDAVSLVALLLIAAGLLQSLLLALQSWEHRRYARSCMASRGNYGSRGRALVISPCKGVDVGLADNLRALLDQDYGDYDVLFVVESEDDPACGVIRWVSAERRRGRLLVAGRAMGGGQKIHNLLAATAEIDSQYELVAFVDSDARPRRDWLRSLVSRLDGREYCAATGYRWFVPQRATLANLLLYSINSALMTLLGKRSHGLVWGGSWAIRRDDFLRLDIRGAWQGALSDDLAAAQALRADPRPTRFEPGAVVCSPHHGTIGQLFEFVRRQYMMARFYAPHWWRFGLAVLLPGNLAWAALAVLAWRWGLQGAGGWTIAALATSLFALSMLRAAMRQSLAGVYFPDMPAALRLARWFDLVAAPLAAFAHAAGAWASVFGRTLSWRGMRYRLHSDGRVEIISAGPRAKPDEVVRLPDDDQVDRRGERRRAA